MGVLWSGMLTRSERQPNLADDSRLEPSMPANRQPLEVAGLVFDMGDVFYDATLWHRWLWQLLTRMGLHSRFDLFFRVWRDDYLHEAQCGRQDYWTALRRYLCAAGMSHGQIDEVIAAGHARFHDFEEEIRPLPGVQATIHALLRQGYQLGVLTNASCSSQRLDGRLKRMGLQDCFRVVLSSADLGHTTPDVLSYEAALSALQLSPTQTAFVGHDARELSGAAGLGMRTVGVNYDFGAQADLLLASIEQLPQQLTSPLLRQAG